jgi:hypothetical protein
MIETSIIYGKFNGQNMLGDDNKIYPINPNYASKSRLNEGDELKLVIGEDGTFIYHQIRRVVTKRLRGHIFWKDNQCWVLTADRMEYRILKSTATYFKLRDKDEAVILIPAEGEAKWAAVENVIRILKDEEQEMELNQ